MKNRGQQKCLDKALAMERDLYKQIQLARNIDKTNYNLKTIRKSRNFKATANFFNFFYYKKEKEKLK